MQEEQLDIYYLRLSKEDGDVEAGTAEESMSIASQRRCIEQFVLHQPDLSLEMEEIVDDGYSGTNMDRPGMQRLLRMVKAGLVRTIIVRDLSRFSRNYLEGGYYLECVFPLYHVRFISINDRFDSKQLGENTGGLELAIKNLINELYSKDISRKIKSSVDIKKMSGAFVYGTAPYGYKKAEEKYRIVIDPVAARQVKRIFEWAASGITITQIAQQLNREGITTPSVYLASIRGKYKTRSFWTYESVRNILHNRIYTGDTIPFKSSVVRVGSRHVKMIPDEKQIILPDTHEAIVPRTLYEQAQKVVKAKSRSVTKASGNPLTSFLFCGCCGNRLVKGKAQNRNWLCTSARYRPDSDCSRVRIDEGQLRTVLLRAIQNQCSLIDAKMKRVRIKENESTTECDRLRAEIKRKKNHIERLHEQKMQSYERYAMGKISKETFLEEKCEALRKEQGIQEEISKLEECLIIGTKTQRKQKSCIAEQQRILKEAEISGISRTLMKELVQSITVYPKGEINIKWNFRDEIGNAEEAI